MRVVILAVVAGAGLIGGASWWLAAGRVGRVELTNDGPPLVAQLLPKSGDAPLGVPFDIVTRAALTLAEGDYRLRVHGSGWLGRTYRFAVNRGETLTHALALDEGRLLGQGPRGAFAGQPKPREEPAPFVMGTAAVALTPGRADLIERSQRGLVRRDAVSGQATWAIGGAPDRPGNPRRPTTWLDHLLALSSPHRQGQVVEPAADLDGDGTADLVWALSDLGALLAVSGRDGSILWDYTGEPDGPGGPRPGGPDRRPGPNGNRFQMPGEPVEKGGRWRQVIGSPAAADVDGDGTPDLVATFSFSETDEEIARRTGVASDSAPNGRRPDPLYRRVAVAVAGRTGRPLWTRPLDEAFTTPSQPAWQRPVEVVPARGGVALGLLDGARWVGFDAKTGTPRAQAVDLGFAPVRPVQHADLDGDGTPDLLALGVGSADAPLTLAAFSGESGRSLWAEPVRAQHGPLFGGATAPPLWPLVADLDGDGRPEIAVADAGPLPPGTGSRGLRLVDGATGRTRWSRPMRPETPGGDGLFEVVAAPDLDGDGTRDLVATSFFLGRGPSSPTEGSPPVPERAYVDALSGRDGRPLWWWHRALPTDKQARLAPLRWWGRGPDGWPLLAVGVGDSDLGSGLNTNGTIPPVVHNLEASTGRDVATVVGLGTPSVADLDGDGLLDLWGEADGQLRAFGGEPPVAWRALGRFAPAEAPRSLGDGSAPSAADLDGDGVADVLGTGLRADSRNPKEPITSHGLGPALAQGFTPGESAGPPPGSRTAVARSGRDGRLLWRAVLGESWAGLRDDRGATIALTALPLPGGDLDGDGTPDVIAQATTLVRPGGFVLKHAATLPLRALSGRTGRPLWSAGPLPLGFRAFGDSQVHWFRALIVEPGTPPDLVVGHRSPFAPSAPPSPGFNAPRRPHLARVSGRTGQLLWDVALSEQAEQPGPGAAPAPGFGDLDGDGTPDAVLDIPDLAGSNGIGHEVHAVSLRDGRRLWGHRLAAQGGIFDQPQLTVADLDGDGRAEVVVGDRAEAGGRPGHVFQALGGRDGRPRWTFRVDADKPQLPGVVVFLADLDGRGRRSVGLAFTNWGAADFQGVRRLVVLGAEGLVRADRDLTIPPNTNAIRAYGYTAPFAKDLTGDGRDEVVFFSAGRLRVWGPDLKEIWSLRQDASGIDRVIPGPAGRPASLLSIQPMQALDGTDGHHLWAGQVTHAGWGLLRSQLLDPGGADRRPLLLDGGPGTTTCRWAIPTTPNGTPAPPRGALVPRGLALDDPRWARPLPWAELADRDDVRSAVAPAVVLALLNVGLPLAILGVVGGRRRGLRLVMALPAAAVVPLIVFKALEPSIPVLPAPWPSSPALLFLLGSLAGVPILAVPAVTGWALVGNRWRLLARLAGGTAGASLAIGAAWLAWDRRAMPPIEHRDWSGWAWVVAPGAVVAVGLWLIGRAAGGAARLVATRR